MNESTAAIDDSVMTTSSTATGGKKTKARKATSKGRKTKAKKEAPAEDVETSLQEEEPSKLSRGRKRDSSAIEDVSMATSDAPPGKKRATRAVNESTVEQDEDSDMAEAPAPKKGGKKKTTRKPTAKSSHDVSTTSITEEVVSTGYEATPGTFPDDDEIERQLEADLENQLTEDEELTFDSDSERRQKKEKRSESSMARAEQQEYSRDYAMLNPEPVVPDEDEIDDDLKALQAEMEVNEPELEHEPEHEPEPEAGPQELEVPKKGRKAGTRKVSKQSKSKKTKAAPQPEEDEAEPEQTQAEETEQEIAQPEEHSQVDEPVHNDSIASTDTVVKKSGAARLSTGKRGRGRPSKASMASRASINDLELVEADRHLAAVRVLVRREIQPARASAKAYTKIS